MGEAAAAAFFQEEKQIRVVRGDTPLHAQRRKKHVFVDLTAATRSSKFSESGFTHYALCLTLESLVHPFLSRVSSKTPSKYFFSYVLNFRNLHIFVKYHGEEGNIKYSYIFISRFLSNRRTFDLLTKSCPEKKDRGESFASFGVSIQNDSKGTSDREVREECFAA